MRRLVCLLALAVSSLVAQKLDPIHWALGPIPAAKAGAEFKIPVRAKLDAGWHLYSLTTPPLLNPPKFKLLKRPRLK
ncbi:hypothetical protein [Bryobacter aggregatus]|uniref:hypothetical protein n=1 Tax=Bryobacter aggregatus TaxID=360054 RepID=UPI0004E10B65|nr:hypothetical protein [Bryobacter aggregatus]